MSLPESLPSSSPPTRVRTILVVEDNEVFRLALQEILSVRGYDVILAADAEEGSKRLHEVDLVLLDGMLPGRDGWDLCREIRARYGSSLPIVIITARAEPEIRSRSLRAGADACIIKPFRVAQLMDCLAPLLERRTGA